MHNLFLGLIQEHFQGILGIRLDKDDHAEEPAFDLNILIDLSTLLPQEQKSTRKLLKWLQMPLNNDLSSATGKKLWFNRFMTLHISSLQLVCKGLKCPALTSEGEKHKLYKNDWVLRLLDWVSDH